MEAKGHLSSIQEHEALKTCGKSYHFRMEKKVSCDLCECMCQGEHQALVLSVQSTV